MFQEQPPTVNTPPKIDPKAPDLGIEPKANNQTPTFTFKVDEKGIEDLVTPVVQQARLEAVKKRIKAQTEELTQGDQKLLGKYESIVEKALEENGGWMTIAQVNERAVGFLSEQQNEVLQNLLDEVKKILGTLNLDTANDRAKHDPQLVTIKLELQLIAKSSGKPWQQLASEAGTTNHIIKALENAGQKSKNGQPTPAQNQ